MRLPSALAALAALAALGPSAPALAAELRPLPEPLLRAYARVLSTSEIALVEMDASGRARQLSLVGYAAAPPERVRELVANPEAYPSYVRNLKSTEVERLPDGRVRNKWKISYPVGSFEGVDELRFEPGPRGAVVVAAADPGKSGVTRWEFLPAPGGGTLVATYAVPDSLTDNFFLKMLVGKEPIYEVGLSFAGQLTILRAVIAEANRRAAQSNDPIQLPPNDPAPGFGALLDRGTVVVVRSGPGGPLVDVSVVERVPAAKSRVLAVVRGPETWPRFVRSIKRSAVLARDPEGLEYELTVSAVIDATARFRLQYAPDGADTLCLSGDLRSARYRWDLRDEPDGKTLLVWRGNMHVADHSRIVRALFRIEPSFEHAANLTVGLMMVRVMAKHAAEGERGGGDGAR